MAPRGDQKKVNEMAQPGYGQATRVRGIEKINARVAVATMADARLESEVEKLRSSSLALDCGGHAAIFAWSDLVLDRSRKRAGSQSPTAFATRSGDEFDPNFEN